MTTSDTHAVKRAIISAEQRFRQRVDRLTQQHLRDIAHLKSQLTEKKREIRP